MTDEDKANEEDAPDVFDNPRYISVAVRSYLASVSCMILNTSMYSSSPTAVPSACALSRWTAFLFKTLDLLVEAITGLATLAPAG